MPLDHFALIAPLYDRIFRHRDVTRLREHLELPAAGWALDAAGGTGRVAQLLRDQVERIVVADISWGMLQQARGKVGLLSVNARIERLPFPDGTFDRILMIDAFHHLSDHRSAAAELIRVLAPGGRLVIEEPNIERWPIRLIALMERLMLMRSRFFPPAALAGFFDTPDTHVRWDADDAISVWVVVERSRA